MNTVFFHVRYDAETKAGGDSNLLRSYAALLSENSNYQIEISNKPSKHLSDYVAVIAANIDRPFESAKLLEQCNQFKVPFILYCLHHPYKGISSYLKHGAKGGRRVLAMLSLFDPNRYEMISWFIKVVISWFRKIKYKKGSILPLMSVNRAQNFLIEFSSVLLMTSKSEKDQIEFDIGVIKTDFYFLPHIIPSTVDTEFENNNIPSRLDIKVLVPGRFESRKNQQKIISLVDFFPTWEFVFVGDTSPTEQDYGNKIIRELACKDNVSYISHLPQKQFLDILKSADIILCASWFEVTSIIELSAASYGKQLVATTHSYLQEFYPDYIAIDPNSINSIKRGLEIASERLLREKENKFLYPNKSEISDQLKCVIEKIRH